MASTEYYYTRWGNERAFVLPEPATDTYFDALTTSLTTLDLFAGCRGKWVKGEHGEGLRITTKSQEFLLETGGRTDGQKKEQE